MRRGKLITLEGIDGAGKTTQRARIAAWLRRRGFEVVETREPGGTETAEKLRGVILEGDWRLESEVLVMFAARVEHLYAKIIPALERGAFVVCDRFLDSTYAYQGFGKGFPLERLDRLAEWLVTVRPDRTFWLDVPIAIGLARSKRRARTNRFEQEALLTRVREGYRWLWQREKGRILRIDADRPLEEVWQEIEDHLKRWLANG